MKIKKIDSLNLIPFIDVMLVLLVIILTTTSFISKDMINIDVPNVEQANNNSNINNKDTIISINKNSDLFFNDKKVTKEELKQQISTLNKDSNIIINGDKKSNFNDFVSVMNILEKAGFENLFILVNNE